MDIRARTVWKYTAPAMLSNVCYFMFTMVDGIFVGNGAGTNALGAVNLVLPMVMITSAVYQLIYIGGVTVTGLHLGAGENEAANQSFMHTVLLTLAAGAVFTLGGTAFARPICRLLGAEETFIEDAVQYMFWYSIFSAPSGLALCFQSFCRNDGAPGMVALSVGISTAVNVFLDWLLVFPLKMGTGGAAIATGISQTIAFIVAIWYFFQKKGVLRLHWPKLNRRLFGKIFICGLPEGVAQCSMPVMTLCMNLVLIERVGPIGVNSFSVISFMSSFVNAVFYGTSEGFQPLFSRCCGAEEWDDLRYYFRVGLRINMIGSAFIVAVMMIFSRFIGGIFGTDLDTLNYVVAHLPSFTWGFVVMSVNAIISAFFYSIAHPKQALMINVMRCAGVNVAVILLLPVLFGEGIIWYTFGIYEFIVALLSVYLYRRVSRNFNLGKEEIA